MINMFKNTVVMTDDNHSVLELVDLENNISVTCTIDRNDNGKITYFASIVIPPGFVAARCTMYTSCSTETSLVIVSSDYGVQIDRSVTDDELKGLNLDIDSLCKILVDKDTILTAIKWFYPDATGVMDQDYDIFESVIKRNEDVTCYKHMRKRRRLE